MESDILKYLNEYESIFTISPTNEAKKLAQKYHFLDYMVERYINMFGNLNEVEEYLYSCSFPLIRSIRCNTLRINCEKLEKIMSEKGFILDKVSWLPHGYVVKKSPKKPSLGATLEYLVGYYHIQGLASMVPAYVLNPGQKDIVLDMAAAPGGKTTQLAQIMNNKGLIVAVERNRERIKSLLSNINRLGVENVLLIRTPAENLLKTNLKFSKILLDAPCSGEGLIQKDPSRRYKTTIEDLRKFAITQLSLIKVAYQLLEEGGYLVYSTCSIAPEEDELIVNYAIEKLGMLTVNVSGYPAEKGYETYHNINFSSYVKNCLRFFPHKHGTEGFFICLLRKE
ncbi:RsmB/NOP family class I SAM-dependent RNA methyltransferase [Saccharolobus caldissimus]|uniref:RNA methyltransferase n=1 Tax=Saccharolobus caldissimus TaxID=1702097 RepID=A0AAQ4CMW5_9CREN|nr:RsmB/NOP family class I SAM-dependent RNA methyltransferase [Saccharolobus caldissimus]BDB97146.1 RNA methyltransferase [Saccharolobus caldissimus]